MNSTDTKNMSTSTSPTTSTNKNKDITPTWWRRLIAAYQSGAAGVFILHGNVEDHVMPGVYLRPFLREALASREAVVFYDRTGWTFPLPGSEARVRQALGMEAQAQASALAALTGAQPQPRAPEFPAEPAAAFGLLRKLLFDNTLRSAAVVFYADLLFPATDVSTTPAAERTAITHILEMARPDAMLPNLLILVCRSLPDLHSALRSATSGILAVEVPMPGREERLEFIRWFLQTTGEDIAFRDLTPERLADQTAGLTLVHVENILLEARAAGGVLTADAARDMKESMIRQEYAGLVEIMDHVFGFEDVGGMERLKAWARREIIEPLAAGRTKDAPKGVLLVGPPGTGKTFFVRALAREIGFNAVALNMENVLGGIVGESEKRLARVLSLVKSLAPVLVFIDEIDQSDVSRRGNDSGNPVAQNLFSQILRFLGDESNRGKVIFFAASNRPDLIDPALMRFGRIDAVIPVLLPDREERAAILAAQARAQGTEMTPAAVSALVDGSEGYSAADLAALVAKARRLGGGRIGTEEATRALQAIRPNSLQLAEYYTLLAVQAVNDADLLPPAYARLLADRQQLRQQIESQTPAEFRRRGRAL